MVMKGETIKTGAPDTCPKCKVKVKPEVLFSGAGYYIGTRCNCGIYSRESGYYATRGMAQEALINNDYDRPLGYFP